MPASINILNTRLQSSEVVASTRVWRCSGGFLNCTVPRGFSVADCAMVSKGLLDSLAELINC